MGAWNWGRPSTKTWCSDTAKARPTVPAPTGRCDRRLGRGRASVHRRPLGWHWPRVYSGPPGRLLEPAVAGRRRVDRRGIIRLRPIVGRGPGECGNQPLLCHVVQVRAQHAGRQRPQRVDRCRGVRAPLDNEEQGSASGGKGVLEVADEQGVENPGGQSGARRSGAGTKKDSQQGSDDRKSQQPAVCSARQCAFTRQPQRLDELDLVVFAAVGQGSALEV
jgi:hypothetical protein